MRRMSAPRFACETARRRVVDVRGLRLSMLEWPAGGRPPLCFLHGGSAHAHWFDLVVPAFLHRFHVIALDQRGHGESTWPDPPSYATEDFVGDLVALFDALGWARTILVGHSMGGHNAMACSAWHPDRVRALVIADSRPAIPPDRLGMMHRRGERGVRLHATLDAAVDAFRLRPRDTLAPPELIRHIGRAGVTERDGGFTYRFDPNTSALRRPTDGWALMGRITAPTLIVRAGRSPGLTPELAARLHAGIAGSRLVEIPDAFHHLVFDRPREVAAAIDAFLAEVVPEARRDAAAHVASTPD